MEQPDLPEVPVEQSDQRPVKLPSQLWRQTLLMCPPLSVSAGSPNNVFMQNQPKEGRVVNRAKALRQFLDIYSFVSNMSMTYLLPSKEGLQDVPYVANLGVVLPSVAKDTVVISNYASEPRRDETPLGEQFFRMLGYDTVIAPEYFEGEADLKYLGNNNYAGAWGNRTTSSTLVWFERQFGINVIPVHLTDPQLYHLDCALFPLSDKQLLCAVDSLDKDDVKALEKVIDIIPVSTAMAQQGITNCLRVNRVVMCGTMFEGWTPADDQWLAERDKIDALTNICAKYGYEPVLFDISEFAKSGAALSCLVMHLNFPAMDSVEE